MANHLLFLGGLGTGEIVVIALVVLLLFGGKKIPELMKGLGKGVNSFKQGMNEIEKAPLPRKRKRITRKRNKLNTNPLI